MPQESSATGTPQIAVEKSPSPFEDVTEENPLRPPNQEIGVAPPQSPRGGRHLEGVEPLYAKRSHKRHNSFVTVQHVRPTPEQLQDLAAGSNANAEWVNLKGAWVIHIVLIVLAKMIVNEIPGVSNALKWTIVNVGYMLVTYILFHWAKGTPFENNSGAYDDLTLWEQIDEGAQYTPAKKYLTSVPIALYVATNQLPPLDPLLTV